MDVDSLRTDLENHLQKNPDKDAPGGFRDRFETVVALIAAGDEDFPKEALEQQLQHIHDEAEAAWKAADGEPAEAPAAKPKGRAAKAAAGPGPDGEPAAEPAPPPPAEPSAGQAAPAAGGQQGMVLIVGLVVAALAAAYFFFS